MLRPAVAALILAAAAVLPDVAAAQQPEDVRNVARSGPRFGVTWLSPATVDTIYARYDIDILPVITQFGWQFENQIVSLSGGHRAMMEWVLLVGDVEQDEFNPSLGWLTGYRLPSGVEIGVCPNFSYNKDSEDITTVDGRRH